MFWTWRATVCSLITSVDAISRLLFPEATSRSTSSSRDESRKQARALERQGRRPLSSTDRGSRRIEPALSQTQLGQSRLWLPPEPARLLVGPLRGRELALE